MLHIVLNDLRVFFSSRGNLVGVTVMPIAFTLVLGWVFGPDSGDVAHSLRVDLVDSDRTEASAALTDQIGAGSDMLLLCPVDNDAANRCRLAEGQVDISEAQARERLADGVTTAVVVIPRGYAEALESLHAVELAYYSQEDPLAPSPILQQVDAVLQRQNSIAVTQRVGMDLVDKLDASAAGTLFEDAVQRSEFAESLRGHAQRRLQAQDKLVRYATMDATDLEPSLAPSGLSQSVPGMGALFVMFTVLGGMAVLLRERAQGTLQRLIVLPLRRSHILAGKIGAWVVIGLIQYLLIFAVGYLAGEDFGAAPLALFAVMAAFVLCVTALTFALAPRMKSEQQANGLARLLALALAPLGGAWWPLEIVPGFMRTIGHLSPVAWAMDGFRKILLYNGRLDDILLEVSVLLVAAALLFVVGIRNFQVE